ncbi:hypothetical protein CAPTEDRAFT_211197, partial [Capitella teleta]
MKAKKSEEPKDTWLDFKVRLLSAKPYSTYGKADRLAFTACETSNIESETENEKETGPGKRKKQLRMKTCSMGCSAGPEEMQVSTPTGSSVLERYRTTVILKLNTLLREQGETNRLLQEMKAHLMPPLDEMEAILLDKFKDLESFDRFDSGVAGNPQDQKAL